MTFETPRVDDRPCPVSTHPSARWSRVRDPVRLLDIVVAGLLGACVFSVHDVGYMLRRPFWLDEAWIAVSTRASLHQLGLVTSSSPIGFSFVLRLVPGKGEQRYRLVTLVFACGAVVAGYLLGRQVGRARSELAPRVSGLVGGLVVGAAILLAPVMLIRDDLKPYTADACTTLLLFLLLARVEAHWTRERLTAIVGVAAIGMLFSHTVVFAAPAVLGSLATVTVVRRRWSRLVELVVAGGMLAVVMAAIYLTFDKRHQISSTTNYWRPYYVPTGQGLSAVHLFLHERLAPILPLVGVRNAALLATLCVAGTAMLFWLRLPALALATPLLVLLAFTASAMRVYPFLDVRTSTFWLVAVIALMAIVVVGVIRILARWRIVAVVAAVVAAGLWINVTSPYVRGHPLPREDVRSQVRYVDRHRRPGDVVVVSFAATWAFVYYERSLQPTFVHTKKTPLGFPDVLPRFPKVRWLVMMRDRQPANIHTALATARVRLAGHSGGRVWIVVSHAGPSEVATLRADMDARAVRSIPTSTGLNSLLLYEPGATG